MAGPRHNTPSILLSSFEARVQWAIEKRKVYTYNDTAELDVLIPEVALDDDDEDIKDLQRIYESYYRRKKKERKRALEEEENRKREEERIREEENKKRERERILQEIIRKRDSELRTTEKNPNSGLLPQLKRRYDANDNDIPVVRPMKVARVTTISTLWEEYDSPCDRCDQKGVPCHKQNPVRSSCYECRTAKQGCSLVPTAKGVPRGANRRKSTVSSGSSEEDELADDHPTPGGPRRSARNLDRTHSSNDALSKIVIALDTMNATIRDGFDNLQVALEKLGDRSNLTDNKNFINQNHHIIKSRNTPGSSPVY